MAEHTNTLAAEHSPYLRQHMHNPVDWMPWGKAAFDRAKTEDKLVLISIGYSACHWCHVMERETFEDLEAAAFMNAHFVNVKVDREERPDVDQVYMDAVQLMTQRGGWPLNCFALPDGRPIYGGTYFRKEQWMEVLQLLVRLMADDREKVAQYAEELTSAIQHNDALDIQPSTLPLPDGLTVQLVAEWKPHWDRNNGGPIGAPKFPMPVNYRALLQYGIQNGDPDALQFAHLTLKSIIRGGIYDQLAGGIARYSVDERWKVPHFEKMLYDNGQLLSWLGEAHRSEPSTEYARAMRQTVLWLDREMTDETGLFYAALDADSEGEEGKFYVWTLPEFKRHLPAEHPWLTTYFGMDDSGHWEDGNYVLLRSESDQVVARRQGLDETEFYRLIDPMRSSLLDARNQRVHPGLDYKLIVGWNALTISGLTEVYRALEDDSALHMALRAGQVLREDWKLHGAVRHTFHQPEQGFLDDHALLAQAFLDLYAATFNTQWVYDCLQLMEQTWRDFADESSGMCWYTSHQAETLIARKQDNHDNVIPAAGGTFALVCFHLGERLGDTTWTDRAIQMLRNMLPEMRHARSVSQWFRLLDQLKHPYYHVCISGTNALAAAQSLSRENLPNVMVSLVTDSAPLPIMAGKSTESLTFYVCEGMTCNRPVHTLAEALDQLI